VREAASDRRAHVGVETDPGAVVLRQGRLNLGGAGGLLLVRPGGRGFGVPRGRSSSRSQAR